MNIISFSTTPSPFPPIPMSKISAELAKQAAMDVRKNKAKEKAK